MLPRRWTKRQSGSPLDKAALWDSFNAEQASTALRFSISFPFSISSQGQRSESLSGVPAPVITMALMARFSSQGKSDYARKLLAMMRAKFGGHEVKKQANNTA